MIGQAPGTFNPLNYGDAAEYSNARNGVVDLDVERAMFRKVPPWHRLGDVFTDSPTLTEAVARSGNDYEVICRPGKLELNGELRDSDRFFNVVRGPARGDWTERELGIATKQFRPIQNREIAEVLDPLTKQWPVESIGTLKNGETFFACLQAGGADIEGDPIWNYYAIVDSKVPGGSLTIAYEPIRLECGNCIRIGLSLATVKVNLRHSGDVLERFTGYAELMASMRGATEEALAEMRGMARLKLVRSQVKEIFDRAYPEPPSPKSLLQFAGVADKPAFVGRDATKWQQDVERMQRYKIESFELYDTFCAEFPRFAGTGYAVLQAVTEAEDHRRETVANARSSIFGDGAKAKNRAWAAISELAR
jgi:hypothetical protein